MMQQRSVNPSLILLAIVGFICFISINVISNVESEYALDLSPDISKEAASQMAVEYIQSNQKNSSFNTFVSLQTHKKFAGYLNKNNLVESYTTDFSDSYPLDYFQVELVEIRGEDRFLVHVHMKDGQILGWNKVINKQLIRPQYNPSIVEEYLQTKGYNPSVFKLITEPNVKKNTIIYESNINNIADSTLQLHIIVHEGEVVSFRPLFSIPESYVKWLDEQDSQASWMTRISLGFSLLMMIAAVVLSIIYRKQVTFKRGLFLTFIFIVTYSIHNLNMYPAYRGMFAGETNHELLVIINIILLTLTTIVMGASMYFSLITGDALWRMEGKNLWPRWNESTYGHHVIQAMGKGYLFCLIILGFQAIVIFIGEQVFDVWSVNDPLFSNHNLWLPLIFPILAWAAAISEEAIYRFFGIIIFKKIVKNTFLSVLIPSMIWALGHVQYPIYPAYTRFVEVTILGLIFGYIFLKHGFITAIFAHVSVNSLLMGLSIMVIPGGTANSLMGLFFVASPAITAYIIYWIHPLFRKSNPAPKVHP